MEMSRPAPSPKVLNTPDLASWVQGHCAEFPGPFEYMQRLERIFGGKGYDSWLKFVARLVEPTEGRALVDPTARRAGNFYSGGLVGLRVIDHAVGADVLQHMALPAYTEEVKGQLDMDRLRALREAIMAQGQRSYESAAPFHPMFDAWSRQMPRERYDQEHLHAGFGFVHGFAIKAVERQFELDLSKAQAEADYADRHPLDWNRGLYDLLRSMRDQTPN